MHHGHEKIQLRAPQVAMILSVLLAIFKITAGIRYSSLSFIASGFDSVFDAVASGASFLLLRMSLAPADQEHPYGHSRIESVATLAQGVLLFLIAGGLAYAAAQRFGRHQEVQHMTASLVIPLICSAITFALWIYLGQVVKKTGSKVIAADRLHYFSDLSGNILLFLGFLASKIWRIYDVDAILTVILCAFLGTGVYKIIIDSVNDLVDRHDPETETNIKSILKAFYPRALGAARIRSRKSGRQTALDIELVSCRQKMFQEVHDISHEVQQAILQKMPSTDLIIHSEPCDRTYCETDNHCRVKLEQNGRNPKTE